MVNPLKSLFLFFFIVVSFAIQVYTALPLSLLLVMALALYLPPKISLISSSFIGLIADLFIGSTLGLHGFFYLSSCFLLVLYQRKFHSASIWFVGLSVLGLSSLYYRLFFHFIPWRALVKLLIIMIAMHLSIGQVWMRESKRLRV